MPTSYKTKVRLALGVSLAAALVTYILVPYALAPKLAPTEWRGNLLTAQITNVTATNYSVSVYPNPDIEVGLRADGVVVWRKK